MSTQDQSYTERLHSKQNVWWKRWIDVQAPYRWNLRRLKPGFVLDIGCGIGRNLMHLGGNGVGLDHNPQSVELTRGLGFKAFQPDEFVTSEYNVPQSFDSLLLSHVAEHMRAEECVELIRTYESLIKANVKLIVICPQEAGFRSDSTHVEFMDFDKITRLMKQTSFAPSVEFSFPFPRVVGRLLPYNEFVCVGAKKSAGEG